MKNIENRIKEQISNHGLVLYMKGSPAMPMCGFSARVVQILNILNAEFESHNVLEDPELREGIKQFSNWPTIPQIYHKGEFLGGCDIFTEMYQNGELEQLLKSGSDKGSQTEITE